jgi:Putative adhesin
MSDGIDFLKNDTGSDGDDAVRRGSWPVKGPAELELSVDVGRVTVDLADAEDVTVEVRYDPSAVGGWLQGVSGLISWLGNATGSGDGPDPEWLASEAVRGAEITWSEPARRLVVRSSQDLPLRAVPLLVTVTAPAGSRVAARTGAGDVAVAGRAGWAAVRTGSGRATLGPVDGDADVTTGSGDITLGDVSGRSRVRTGSGAISLAAAGGTTDIKAGSGDVELGAVAGDLHVRTGSGDLRISDARAGSYDLTTGSGELRLGVHPGVRARLDLSSGSGTARSELDVAAVAPEQGTPLQVRGRTGSGDVLVTRAVVPA